MSFEYTDKDGDRVRGGVKEAASGHHAGEEVYGISANERYGTYLTKEAAEELAKDLLAWAKPSLPTASGSVIREEGRMFGGPDLTLVLTDDGWRDHEGDPRDPEQWAHDQWTLIYDAAKEAA